MSKTTLKADINFEHELWKAANELRGKVSILELNAILQEIMEQAEVQFKEWRLRNKC